MNNLIACGDLHAEKNTPRYRKDEYWHTWQDKMLWIIQYANKNKARLLIAGDLFNTSRVSPEVTNVVLAIFKEAHYTPYVVAGQHDLKYHTNIEKTPIFTLALAKAVRVIQGNYKYCTGAGFEEYIPENGSRFLITHTCITPKKPPFFLKDAISAKKFMRKYPGYEVIISGDYHVPFHVQSKGRHLINCGTIIRNKKDMKKYVPYIWHINMDNKLSIKKVKVPHRPYSKVFDTEAMEFDERHGISVGTDKLKNLVDSSIEKNDLESIIWVMYKKLEEDGNMLNKSLVKEILEESV